MTTNGITERFTAKEFTSFEELLAERRRLLLADLQSQEASEAQASTRESEVLSHVSDQGPEREAADISVERRGSESTEIQEIDDALGRILDGSFGLCEDCEKKISKERLEAIPYTRLCLPCKKEEERGG
jgi:DnaK suppressor protein